MTVSVEVILISQDVIGSNNYSKMKLHVNSLHDKYTQVTRIMQVLFLHAKTAHSS